MRVRVAATITGLAFLATGCTAIADASCGNAGAGEFGSLVCLLSLPGALLQIAAESGSKPGPAPYSPPGQTDSETATTEEPPAVDDPPSHYVTAEYEAASPLLDKGFRRLTASEIRSSLSGNTVVARFEGSRSDFSVFYAADGALRGMRVSPTGTLRTDEGRWRISGDGMLCDEWNNWRAGSDCDSVYLRDNEFVYVNADGTRSSSGTIEPGNTKGL